MNVIQTILDYNKSKESGGKTDITKSDIISALGYTPISELEKGANSGIAELDDNGKVLTSELPSYVDDVEEFNNLVELQKHTGEASKIYITLDDNKCYRWGGTAYVEISSSITLGETSGTAFRGDLGKEAYDKSHTHSNKEVIDNITSEDITNWNNKSDFDGKYTSLTDTPTIPKTWTGTQAEFDEVKSTLETGTIVYITDNETAIDNTIYELNKNSHTHSNKDVLDTITTDKVNEWNSKTSVTKVSELDNDSNYQTDTQVSNIVSNATSSAVGSVMNTVNSSINNLQESKLDKTDFNTFKTNVSSVEYNESTKTLKLFNNL